MEHKFNEWTRKGKKYKTKYFQALGKLLGEGEEINWKPVEERSQVKEGNHSEK